MDLAFSLVAVFFSKLPAWMGAVGHVECRLRYLLPSFSVRLLLPICRQRYFLACSRLRYLLNKCRLRYLITFRAAFFRCRLRHLPTFWATFFGDISIIRGPRPLQYSPCRVFKVLVLPNEVLWVELRLLKLLIGGHHINQLITHIW